jgi:FAD/FMN-containing dehydrogenase
MVAGTSTAPVATGEALDALTASVRGGVLRPGQAGYDDARRVWNGMIDRRPELIARCAGAADVIDAVRFARADGLAVAVRGGGHNVAGSAVGDGAVMVDLSPMRGVRVDPTARTVRVAGGATWADVDRETQVFGLATPGGVVSTTGVGGFTLGGGYGMLRRQYGLTCDNLRSADVVTAAGELVTASADEHADLFWALRGGGGNFGVVTSFEFACHSVGPEVFLCAPLYPLERAAAVLPAWRDFMARVPEALSANAALWTVPAIPDVPAALHGRPVVVVATLYPGDPAAGERLTRPLRELGAPLLDFSGPMPYVVAQAADDAFFPYGTRRYYFKGLDLLSLDDAVIDQLVAAATARPTPSSLITLWHFGGAMSRVAPEATAFWRRHVPFMASFDAIWDDPPDDARCIAWARESWAALRPHSDGGQYVNFPGLGEDGEAQVRAAYGGNYARLVAVKTKYDPENLFRFNLNIPPAATEPGPNG